MTFHAISNKFFHFLRHNMAALFWNKKYAVQQVICGQHISHNFFKMFTTLISVVRKWVEVSYISHFSPCGKCMRPNQLWFYANHFALISYNGFLQKKRSETLVTRCLNGSKWMRTNWILFSSFRSMCADTLKYLSITNCTRESLKINTKKVQQWKLKIFDLSFHYWVICTLQRHLSYSGSL